MTSYLVDAVLLIALLVTSSRVALVYRELRRLRSLQAQYQAALDSSVAALKELKGAIETIRLDVGDKLAAPAPAAVQPSGPAELQERIGEAFRARTASSASNRPAFVPFGDAETVRPLRTAASR